MIRFLAIAPFLVAASIRLVNSDDNGAVRSATPSNFQEIIEFDAEGNYTENSTVKYDGNRFTTTDFGNEFINKCDGTRTFENCVEQSGNDSHRDKADNANIEGKLIIISEVDNVEKYPSFHEGSYIV